MPIGEACSTFKQTFDDIEATANVHIDNFSQVVEALFSGARVKVYTHRKPLTLAAGLALAGMAGYIYIGQSPATLIKLLIPDSVANAYPPMASKIIYTDHSSIPSTKDQEIAYCAQLVLEKSLRSDM